MSLPAFMRRAFGVDPINVAERMVTVEVPASLAVSVGYTLRQLALANPQCGAALERVGAALVKAAVPKEPRVRGEKGVI